MEASIILPAWNEETRIERCIQALKNQVMEDFECIVVDDGSTDSTYKVALNAVAGDPRFRVFYTRNNGLSAARNYALKLTSGKYVFYVDADDLPYKNFLLEPLHFLKENDLDIAFFDASLKNEGLDLIQWNKERRYFHRAYSYGICSGRSMFCKMMENNDFIAPVYLQAARKEAVRWKFKEGMLYEDELYTFQNMLSSERVGHLKKCLYERTCRVGSLVNSRKSLLHSFSKWQSAKAMHKFVENSALQLNREEMAAVQTLSYKCLSFAARIWKSLPNKDANNYFSMRNLDWSEYIKDMQTLS